MIRAPAGGITCLGTTNVSPKRLLKRSAMSLLFQYVASGHRQQEPNRYRITKYQQLAGQDR